MTATCLKGESLEVYKSLNEDDRKVSNTVKRKLQDAFKPEDIKFTSLSRFHERTIYPGETPQKYLYEQLQKSITVRDSNPPRIYSRNIQYAVIAFQKSA